MADLAGFFPNTPGFSAIDFTVNAPTLTTETNSGKTRRVGYGHQFYSWKLSYPPLSQSQLAPTAGFLAQTYGPLLSFEIVLPEISYTSLAGQTTQTITTSQTRAVGEKDVTIAGASGIENILAAGDFFKFSGHSKVYQCVANCTSASDGTATLYFAGGLTTALASAETLTITQTPFTAVRENDAHQVTVGLGGLSQLQIDMRETW
jgi:hypothetical protein